MKRDHGRRCAQSVRCACAVIAPAALVVLAACNSGETRWWNHAAQTEPDRSAIRVEGRTTSVAAVDGKVDLLLPAPRLADIDSISGFQYQGQMNAADLKEAAPGAYIAFGHQLSLLAGTVTDISGNGFYAIGRWADGSDSSGATYNRNQARFWAVGQPVDVSFKNRMAMRCVLASATRPVAADGNTPPGTLLDASAEIRRDFPDQLPKMSLSLRYSIGQDQRTVTLSGAAGGYTSGNMSETRNRTPDPSQRYTLASRFFGPDPQRPHLAASYAVQAPTAGVISGMVALSCS